MIVRAAPPEHYGWIEERVGGRASSTFRAIEAVDAVGRIHGMVGYDGWTPNSVAVSVALDNPAALRHLLPVVFDWPLSGRRVVLAYVAATNSRSVRLIERVGFTLAHRIHDGWEPGVDVLLYERRKEKSR